MEYNKFLKFSIINNYLQFNNKINESYKFYRSLLRLLNRKEIKQNSNTLDDTKLKIFNLKIRYFLLFDNEGIPLILSSIHDSFPLDNEQEEILIKLVKSFILTKQKKIEFVTEKKKYLLYKDYFIYLVIASSKMNTCLIRIFLNFIKTAYLNLIGRCYNKTENIINISKIFEKFFVKPLTNKFIKILKIILDLKEINKTSLIYKFKNLLIYDNNKLLLNYRKIMYKEILNRKYNLDIQFFKYTIFDNNKCINCDKYEMFDYSDTFPKWKIFMNKLSIHNGFNLILIFNSKKLKLKKLKKIENNNNDYEQYLLNDLVSKKFKKKINLLKLFLLSYFELIDNFFTKYFNPINELKYYEIDILKVINDSLNLKLTKDNLINLLYNKFNVIMKRKGKILECPTPVIKELEETEISKNSQKIVNVINQVKQIKDSSYSSSETNETSYSSLLNMNSTEFFQILFPKKSSFQCSSIESNDLLYTPSDTSEYINSKIPGNDISFSSINGFDLESKKKVSQYNLNNYFEEKPSQIYRKKSFKPENNRKINRFSLPSIFNITINIKSNANHKSTKDITSSFKNYLKKIKSSMPSVDSNSPMISNNTKMCRKSKSINDIEIIKKGRNSYFGSGLLLKQLYSNLDNKKYPFKSKLQLIKEIQEKIMKNNYDNNTKFTSQKLVNIKENIKINEMKREYVNCCDSKKENKNEKYMKLESMISLSEEDNQFTYNNQKTINEYYNDKISEELCNKNNILNVLNKKT